MNRYDDWDFKWWGDGDYEKRLREIMEFWKMKDFSLLCTLNTAEIIPLINAPLSINHGHYFIKKSMEVIVYKMPNSLTGLLTQSLELRLFLSEVYDIKQHDKAHYN